MSKKIIILYLIILISIILGANLLLKAPRLTLPQPFNQNYVIWQAKTEMIDLLKGDRTDTVIFGDSVAHNAYIPAELNPHVFNFAIEGHTPVESYYLLKYMINHGKIPKNVVLTYVEFHYYAFGGTFWDEILAYNLPSLTRTDAEEILDNYNKSNTLHEIHPYNSSDLLPLHQEVKEEQGPIRIPYYYDIAIGPLKHIKPDFDLYVGNLIGSYPIRLNTLETRGLIIRDGVSANNSCANRKPNNDQPVETKRSLPTYLKLLADLASENKINVYIIGQPVPESCVDLAKLPGAINFLNADELKASGVSILYQAYVPIPDKFMANMEHVSTEGAHYFTQKVKPIFDAIE